VAENVEEGRRIKSQARSIDSFHSGANFGEVKSEKVAVDGAVRSHVRKSMSTVRNRVGEILKENDVRLEPNGAVFNVQSNSSETRVQRQITESNLSGKKVQVRVFTDSSWASEKEENKSREGYISIVANGAISWYSKLQKVTLSSTEAEYLAATEAAREIIFLNEILDELGILREKSILFIDNSSTIKQIKNPVFHKRSKHVKTRYHWIREAVKNGEFEVIWTPTEDMAADFLTKPVDQKVLSRNLGLIGLV